MFPLLFIDNFYDKLALDITKYYELQKNIGYIFYHKDICFISEKPVEINKSRIQIHADEKPALLFADGYCLWMLHGVQVPKNIVMTPAGKLDCNLVLKEKNAEVRREIIRKIGIERVINKLGAKSIEKSLDNQYELINFDCIDGRFRPYLKMLNPSIGTWHIEGVHPDCDTIEKALAWRDGENIYEKPEILT